VVTSHVGLNMQIQKVFFSFGGRGLLCVFYFGVPIRSQLLPNCVLNMLLNFSIRSHKNVVNMFPNVLNVFHQDVPNSTYHSLSHNFYPKLTLHNVLKVGQREAPLYFYFGGVHLYILSIGIQLANFICASIQNKIDT
jgi:hypothetical protein